MRTSRKTDFRQKNESSARLKITFVEMIYPGQRPELPSLSRHFLLPANRLPAKSEKTSTSESERRDSAREASRTRGGASPAHSLFNRPLSARPARPRLHSAISH